MKRTLLSTIGLCAALALSANLALAQTNNKPTKGTPPEGKLVKGSEVIGAKLFNKQGEHIGEINDVVFDENTGKMTHGMLAVGGWLGIGENITAVPWKHIQQSKKDSPGYVVDVEKSKLTPEMSFKTNDWPNLTEGWYKESYSRFGVPSGGNAKLVRGSKVIGAELFNQNGEDIGEIQNLLVHPNTGKIAYATCEVDKYATTGDKLTNVPWNLIRQSKKDTEGFVVNADKAKLTGAKYFGDNNWPDYNDSAWHDGVYSYYGTDPFWTDGRVY
jgi:sporulation protein YlmC with PRC-barrel domain